MELPVIENCDNCGACCMDAGLPPFSGTEIDALPEHIQIELAHYNMTERSRNMPCVWLDCEMNCSKYEHRPKFCRDYEVGCHSCRTVRYQYGIDGEVDN
jgi:Fe-S-cluster containining protein